MTEMRIGVDKATGVDRTVGALWRDSKVVARIDDEEIVRYIDSLQRNVKWLSERLVSSAKTVPQFLAILGITVDWARAPEWANYAVPRIWWNSTEGAVIRFEYYEEILEWDDVDERWQWKSGKWDYDKPDAGIPLQNLVCGKDSLRCRPKAPTE